MFKRISVDILVLISFITSVASAAGVTEDSSWFGPELGIIQRVYDDCQDKNDITGCLKGKALLALSKAVEQDSIPLLDGIYLMKQNASENNRYDEPNIITNSRMLNGLSAIDRGLLQKVENFFKSHVLKIDMSDSRGHKRKSKKHYKYVIAALLTAMGIAGPIGLKALAAIAGKALVISKVALTIAGIIALKKIFSSDHHEETSFQVHAGGEHNRRNTYLVRPVKPNPTPVDPYRYYYDQYAAANPTYQ